VPLKLATAAAAAAIRLPQAFDNDVYNVFLSKTFTTRKRVLFALKNKRRKKGGQIKIVRQSPKGFMHSGRGGRVRFRKWTTE